MNDRIKYNDEEYLLTWSEYDGGYYLQRLSDWYTSPIFFSKRALINALQTDQIDWEE